MVYPFTLTQADGAGQPEYWQIEVEAETVVEAATKAEELARLDGAFLLRHGQSSVGRYRDDDEFYDDEF